ncbi:uncharacterized protein LOC119669940 [Teleopsis dalmanni]|uniref:uncharacterized protein LOC119669940 n=1 Tax=Teleopsis dalmanni TaxID=139649 RepID=UPI0018CE5158|nr:uncharacterized protein LOC119669940 [Teleopsis dalmanni]
MNTKILCLIVLFVSLTKADEDEEPNLKMDDMVEALETFTSSCEPKPKKEHIKEMLQMKKNPQRETKCLRYCLMKQFDMMNESETEIVIDKAVELMSMGIQNKLGEKELKESAETCAVKAKKITDKCELGYVFSMCVVEELEKRGFKMPEIKE